MQSVISSLEAVAQLALLWLRLEAGSGRKASHLGHVCIRQQCDNEGVVGAASKGSSMKKPLCYVLQALSFWAIRRGVALKLSHVADVRNSWADALSRGAAADREFWSRLVASHELSVPLKKLLSEPWASSAALQQQVLVLVPGCPRDAVCSCYTP